MKDRTYIGIMIFLAITLCGIIYLWLNSKPRTERVPYEVITYLQGADVTIYDTITKFKDRKIIVKMPIEFTKIDSSEVKNKLNTIDSLNELLVEKKVDRFEILDTNISLLKDTILDNVKLKLSYLTGFKEFQVNIKDRERKTTLPNIYIPQDNKSWFERVISDNPYSSLLLSLSLGITLGTTL